MFSAYMFVTATTTCDAGSCHICKIMILFDYAHNTEKANVVAAISRNWQFPGDLLDIALQWRHVEQ